MSVWLKEPLIHFIALGALIFGAYYWMNERSGGSRDDIVVSLRQQENLAATFSRTWQRPPTESELNGLITDYIRQEIAYRESQAMQLDRDDIVIRRRLRQKLEMLTEDVASLTPPGDQQLKAYLDENADAYRVPAVLDFRHIYFDIDEDREQAEREAESLLATLQSGDAQVDITSVGDASLLPLDLRDVRETELDSLFGRGFARAVAEIEAGTWGGPIRSGFGIHLVMIERRVDGRMPELDEVSDQVLRDLMVIRRKQAIDTLYERLSERYAISIEAPQDILPEPAGEGGEQL